MAQEQVAFDVAFKVSPQEESKLQQRLNQVEQKLKFGGPFGAMTKDATAFTNQLDRATQRVITLGAAFGVLSGSTRLFREIVSATLSVEKGLIDLNAVLKVSDQQLGSFGARLFDIARDTSQSFDDVIKAATEFSRQGLSVTETVKRTRDALILARDANIDVLESTRAITAGINSFNREALTSTAIVNKLATADANFAVSSKDLAEALTRTGSSAADAGVSFNQFISLVTAAQQISQRGGATIAQALNTIFTRVQRKDTLQALDSLNVAITDTGGHILPVLTILQNFSKTYDTLTGSVKTQAAELVGGVRNLNVLKATIDDLSKSNSVFAQTQMLVANSTDEAERRNAARNQSLSSMVSRLGTTGKQIGANIGQLGFAQPARELLTAASDNPITQAFKNAGDPANESAGAAVAQQFLKGFGGAVSYGLLPLITTILFKVGGRVFENLGNDIMAITRLTDKDAQRAAIEKDVVALYQAGNMALQQQLATMTSLAERAALVQKYLQMGTAGATEATIMAAALQRRGYTPRSAEGHIPLGSEAAAIAAGVGGAPANARPVYMPDFNRGGGKFGIVANTSEWMVPGSAGGAIFNRDMIQRYGLPPGAKPVAAGGFVPNAAEGNFIGSPEESRFGHLPMQLGSGYGLKLPQQDLKTLDSLFTSLSKAATTTEAHQFGPQIIDMAKALDKVSEKGVLRTLFKDLNRISDMEATRAKLPEYGYGPPSPSEKRLAQMRSAANVAAAQSSPVITAAPTSAAGLAQYLEERNASGGMGLDYNAYMAQVATRSRMRSYANRKGGPSMEQTEATLNANEAIEGFGRLPPELIANMRQGKAPSRLGRFGRFAASPLGTLAVGFGASALGSMLPTAFSSALPNVSQTGGTGSGMAIGAVSNALQGVGAGVSFGSMFGPQGALIGGGIGAVMGGLYGAMAKATKSLDEMAHEIDQRNKKLGDDVNTTMEVFRLQEELRNVLGNTSLTEGERTQRAGELRSERNDNIARIRNPKYVALATTGINDPNSPVEVQRLANQERMSNLRPDNLKMTAMKGIAKGQFGDLFLDDNASDDLRNELIPILKRYSNGELLGVSKQMQKDPKAALQDIFKKAGMSTKDLEEMRPVAAGFSQNAITEAMFAAMRARAPGQLSLDPDPNNKQLNEERDRPDRIIALAASLRSQAERQRISSTGLFQIGQASQRISLQSPLLTDIAKLQLEGSYGAADIREQSGIDKASVLKSGIGDLVQHISGLKLAGKETEDRISKITSVQGLLDLQKDLATPGGSRRKDVQGLVGDNAFSKLLSDLTEKMKTLNATEQVNIKVNNEINRRLVQQLQEKGTFGGALKDDIGDMIKADKDLTDALNRNESDQTIAGLSARNDRAKLNSQRRLGVINEEQFRSGSLGIDLGQQYTDERYKRVATLAQGDAGNPLATGAQKIADVSLTMREIEQSLTRRQNELRALQAQGMGFRVSTGAREGNQGLLEKQDAAKTAYGISVRMNDDEQTRNQRRLETLDADLDMERRAGRSEASTRLQALFNRKQIATQSRFTSGSEIARANMDVATEQGLQGDSGGSLKGGFQSVFSQFKRDAAQFADIGQRLAQSLESSLGNAFGEFVTGAKKGKDAFRDFAVSVLSDASRMLASKAIQTVLSSIPGFSPAGATGGEFIGSAFHFAGGGKVPAMLMGGEYYISPRAAKSIGYDKLRALNSGQGYAEGGLVRGGSGVRDDVPARLAPGSFIVKKGAVQRLGPDYLDSLVHGKVQHRFVGGLIASLFGSTLSGAATGAIIGGGLGYALGGKKGALGGALLGGIGGGLYGYNYSSFASAASPGAAMAGPTLSIGAKAALGLGASAGLGLLAAGVGDRKGTPGPISYGQIPGYARDLEAGQAAAISGNAGKYPYLQIGPQGQSYIAGYGDSPVTRRWASAGGDDMSLGGAPDRSSGNSSAPQVNIKIDINNANASSTSTNGGGSGLSDTSVAKLEKLVKGWTQEELVNQSRTDGFLTQKSRFVNRS